MKHLLFRSALLLRSPNFATYKIIKNSYHEVSPVNAARVHFCSAAQAGARTVAADLHSEPCAFPELMDPGTSSIIVGIDPDTNGAIAVLSWRNSSLPSASALELAALADVAIFDMPTEMVTTAARKRRQVRPEGVLDVIRSIEATGRSGNAAIRVALESTRPTHLSGKFAWHCSGFASGLLTGIFISHQLPYCLVSMAWKRQMGLYRLGKEGSLALARQLFPQAADTHLK